MSKHLSFPTFLLRHQRLLQQVLELTPSTMAVAMEIASHSDGCFASRESIQDNTCLSDGSVKIAFRKLQRTTFDGRPLLVLTRRSGGVRSPGSIYFKELPGLLLMWKRVWEVPYNRVPTVLVRLASKVCHLDNDELSKGQPRSDRGQQVAPTSIRGGGNGSPHSGGNGVPPTDHRTSRPEFPPPSEDECSTSDEYNGHPDLADKEKAESSPPPEEPTGASEACHDRPSGEASSKPPKKQCSNCDTLKPATPDFFHRDRRIKRDGLRSVCCECWNSYQKEQARKARKAEFQRRSEEFYRKFPQFAPGGQASEPEDKEAERGQP